MHSKIYLISAATALGGQLFGFDIALINGASAIACLALTFTLLSQA